MYRKQSTALYYGDHIYVLILQDIAIFFILIFFDSSQIISHNLKSIIFMLTRKQTMETMVGEYSVLPKRQPGKPAENTVNTGF